MTRSAERRLRSFAWLMAGVGIGSGAALLMAPYTGEEVRFALRRGYHRTAKRLGRHTEDLRDRAEDLLERVHDLRDQAHHIGKSGSKLIRRMSA